MKKTVSYLSAFLIAGLVLLAMQACQAQPRGGLIPAGPNQHWLLPTLQQSWQYYKHRLMDNDQRVQSNHYGGTISEGQSYAMQRAVWMEDPWTFDRVWQWTRLNMKRPSDHLFGWRWGQHDNNSWGLIETDNATDADQDIAYALLLAGEKWRRPDYIAAARTIIHDLWQINVVEIQGHHYMTPGTWEGFRQEYLTMNPSYQAPYVYRKFAKYDAAHAAEWRQMAEEVYGLLDACTSLTSIGVPPNWFSVNWKTGKIGYSDRQGDGSRDLTFDASRVMWRMGLDAALGSERAKQYLLAHPFLLNYWQQHHKMPTGFTWKGKPIDGDSTGFQRGGVLVLNHIHQPTYSREQYSKLFAQSFHAGGYWFNDYNEYLHSVIWFSLYSVYALDTYPTSTILAKNAPSRPQKLESNQSVK